MAKPNKQDPLASYRAYSTRAQPPKKKRRVGLYALAALGVLVFSAVWNPPTGSVHEFTEASDYRVERESGCTNSGKGCHGDESSYRSFNDYHPNAKCTTCHDYQGVGCIPCHSPKNHECQVCHDGSLPQAPDRVRLADPYPRGHYRESTHTAMATPFDTKVRAAESGKAKATCKSCHSRDLAEAHLGVNEVEGSQYGTEVGCGECHNDTRAFGQKQVLADWKPERSCEACHRKGSSSPAHATDIADPVTASSKLGCGATGTGCHASKDLHALHADRPRDCSSAKGESKGCHDLEVESAPAKKRSCASGDKSCHPSYVNDDYSHKKDARLHAPEGTAAAADHSYFNTPCGDCHWMEPDGTSLVGEHLRSTSSRDNDPNVCRACHNDPASASAISRDWPNRDSAAGCSDCHGERSLDPVHSTDIAGSHGAVASSGCAQSGAGCHPTTDLSQVGNSGLHAACLRCHDATPSDGNVAFNPQAKSCGEGRACHAAAGEYDPRTSVHAGTKLTDGRDAAHAASKAFASAKVTEASTGISAVCGDCHTDTLGAEHGRPSNKLAAGNVCRGCHNASPATSRTVKRNWPGSDSAQACEDCHASKSIAARHGSLVSDHGGVELAPGGTATAGACATTGCHATTDLLPLHAYAGGCTTEKCHGATGNIFGADTRSCGGPGSGSACHAGYSALGGHEKVSMTHIGLELTLSGTPVSGTCSRVGCHTTVDLKQLHGADGCGVDGCHEPGSLLARKSCGGSDPAGACHAGFTEAEHFVSHSADLSGTVNGVTYGLTQNVGCFGCHNTDLTVEHSATADAAITGGGASNCRVCHHDPADPGNGRYGDLVDVKGAIAGRDLRCIACHASGSAAPSASAASSPHRRASGESTLAAGFVWADPFSEWRTAFDAPIGGGHNVLTGALVGGTTKLFPQTTYASEGTTYTWELPDNAGDTRWLDGSAFGAGSLATVDDIRHATVGCDDCHVLGNSAGPHGSAVPIAIDPAYSQTEYANPSRGLSSQFGATGTDRVVCMKCHTLLFGSVAGTTTPGGAPVHLQHARHAGAPANHPLRYGEKCVDCHVRIPHAWRSPRLLVRTVPGADRPADSFPYIERGHQGLAAVRLKDISGSAELTKRDCATGDCHGFHSATNHPWPSDIPTATYWP